MLARFGPEHATAVRPRRHVTNPIVEALRDQGLVEPADDEKIPGSLMAGVFPPVVDDGSA